MQMKLQQSRERDGWEEVMINFSSEQHRVASLEKKSGNFLGVPKFIDVLFIVPFSHGRT